MKIDKKNITNKRKFTMKLKMLLLMFLVILVGGYTKTVNAVDIDLEGIYTYADFSSQGKGDCSEGCLIYRIVVRPFKRTFDDMIAGANVWQGYKSTTPSKGQYSGQFLVFTKNKIGNYNGSGSEVGYAKYIMDSVFDIESSEIGKPAISYDKLKNINSNHIKGKLGNDDIYSYNGGKITANYTTGLKEYEKNFLSDVGRNIILGDSNSPIGYYTSGVDSAELESNSQVTIKGITYNELRNALVTPTTGTVSTANSYYVADVIIDSDTTKQLQNHIGEQIYVSTITNTRANSNQLFYTLTPGALLNASGIESYGGGKFSNGTRGVSNEGLQSALNIWDNNLKFEAAEPKTKTIYINHVLQTEDENGNFKYSIINTEEFDTLKESDYTDKKIEGKLTRYTIPSKTKTLEAKTLKEKTYTTYTEQEVELKKAIGYTMVDSEDLFDDLSIDNVYDELLTREIKGTAELDSTINLEITSDIAMVNIIYKGEVEEEEPEDENITITVKHCLYDEKDNFISNLDGNGKILIDKSKTKYPNSIDELIETYVIPAGTSIEVEYNKDNVTTNSVEYSECVVKTATYTTTTTTPSYSNSNVQQNISIEFKYKKSTDKDKDKDIELIILKKQGGVTPDIDGTLTEESTKVWEKCGTSYSLPGNSVDGTSDIRVGIKDVPTYIVAGIRSTNNEQKGTVKINIKIKFGTNTTTKTLEIPYYYLYYTITDAGMYKFMNALVYNSGIGYDTLGTSTFAVENNRRRIYPVIQDGSFSKSNHYITLSDNSWYNIPSYSPSYDFESGKERDCNFCSISWLEVEYYGDKAYSYIDGQDCVYGLTSYSDISIDGYIAGLTKNSSDQWVLDYTLNLFKDETLFSEIDANSNGEIETSDITQIQNQTNTVKNEFKETKKSLNGAITEYNDAVDKYNTARYNFDNSYNEYYEKKLDFIYNQINEIACYYTGRSIYYNGSFNWYNYEQSNKDVEGNYTDNYYYSIRRIWAKLMEYDVDLESNWPYNSFSDLNEALKEEVKFVDNYNNTRNDYNNALITEEKNMEITHNDLVSAEKQHLELKNNLISAMEKEARAIQAFNEAYEIQKLFNEYKNYDNAKMAELLHIDLDFAYDSENLSYVGISLTTTTPQSTNVNYYNYDFKEKETVKLLSEQPYANATQQTYYTKGISYNQIGAAGWSANNNTLSTRYTNNEYIIPKTALNGKRVLAATSTYEIAKRFNNKSGSITDNTYTKSNRYVNDNVITITEYVYTPQNTYTKEYGANKGNSEIFNIYTPLKVEDEVSQDVVIINQDITGSSLYNNTHVIQLNSNFTLNFKTNYSELSTAVNKKYSNTLTNITDFTSRYRQMYYVKFDMDLNNVTYINANGRKVNYGRATANEWIGPIYGDSLSAMPYVNTTGNAVTDANVEVKYTVVAVAVNAQNSWTNLVLQHLKENNDLSTISIKSNLQNECGDEGGIGAGYYSFTKGSLVVVNRIYDFRVTDLADVNWKNVFRVTSSSNVNQHSGISYFAGIRKLNTNNPLVYNEIISRTTEEIGKYPQRILPLGPYKNTDTQYIKAPKIGYRFSFDVKVSGAIDSEYQKKVEIEPKFYYISKDGKTYIENIDLYYKNSKGQYVKIGSPSDTYELYFKPKDGYRSTIVEDINNLATTTQKLGTLSKITLESKTMTTYSENSAAITYYGEYKLPNSTIAVKKGENINNKLSSGYIGVIFDITAIEKNGTKLSYGKDSQKESANVNSFKKNSSQWDFEGYMGITKIGENYSTKLRLEKGTWDITNEIYNKIKGTVMLYDLDDRASDDFN